MRRPVIHALGASIALAGIQVSTASAASPCVATTVQTDVLDERGRARLVEQLAASLRQHDIGTCDGRDAPLANVGVEAAEAAGSVRVRVRDVVTKKEVSRVVRVAALPADGRPLALAVAADELLRASWAEILLARAPAPPPEPPPQVRAVVEASIAIPPARERVPEPTAPSPASARRFFLGAAFAGEHATGGLTLGGIDARFGFYAGERFAVAARVGGRVSPVTSAIDGSTTASALLGGLGAAVALVPRGRAFGLEIPLRVDVEQVQFTAHPAAGARGSNKGAAAVSGALGAAMSVRLGAAWRVTVEGAVGAVLSPVEADDGGQAMTAFSGLLVGGALGVIGEL